ncbi:unnamed protein product [Paramecium sonneborni]|uniref:Uncharacterized protein n=1 Tax=Paramecium sonneborni TaxID=65129 RepID=A0A8S1R091_9CILI|nr:unnamed protein product [Paramecium sonneborni]
MRVQATSFRLPALKLQPKDSQFSLSYGDNNQSSSSMIKYQSNPQRYYDPSPIKKRVRGMTIAIYNSQEKLKTAEFRYGSDLITQTQPLNQSSSVANTVRKYRSKLKQLMYQPPKEDGGLSRDPRIYSFKEPTATIRLDRLTNDRADQQLKDKITQLMSKVKLLLSTQHFYQEPHQQETFQVTMVRLKDEYDCLYQDFNDYYVQNKKVDNQVTSLFNHMEMIKTLLQPKRPIMTRKESIITFDEVPKESTISEPSEKIQETPKLSQIEEIPLPQPQLTPVISYEEPHEESGFTPLTSIQLNEDQPPSDLEKEDIINNNSPCSPKKKRIKNKRSPQKSQKSIILQPSVQDLSLLDLHPQSSQKQQLSSRSKVPLEDIPLKSVRSTQSDQLPEIEKQDETPLSEKAPLKRQISNLGSLNKRRNTVLENKQGRRTQKGAAAISEQDDSQSEQGDTQNQQNEELTENQEEEQSENLTKNYYYDSLLDKLIQSENIYRFPYYQTWEFHENQIIQGIIFGEFDL